MLVRVNGGPDCRYTVRNRATRDVAPPAVRADSGRVRRDDDEERSGEAGGMSWVDKVVIPDDISELDAEVRALRRERRVQRRRSRLRRLTGSGRTTAPLLMVAVLLIAGVAGLLVLFQPRRTAGTVTTIGAPPADRLLPDVPVTLVDGTRRALREFRPGVFALTPSGCRCDAALLTAGAVAHRHNVTFFLVDRTLPALPAGLTEATTTRLVEPTGRVAERFGAEKNGRRVAGGPVLVLVTAAGQIQQVLPQATPRTLERELAEMVPQAAEAS